MSEAWRNVPLQWTSPQNVVFKGGNLMDWDSDARYNTITCDACTLSFDPVTRAPIKDKNNCVGCHSSGKNRFSNASMSCDLAWDVNHKKWRGAQCEPLGLLEADALFQCVEGPRSGKRITTHHLNSLNYVAGDFVDACSMSDYVPKCQDLALQPDIKSDGQCNKTNSGGKFACAPKALSQNAWACAIDKNLPNETEQRDYCQSIDATYCSWRQ